MAEVPLSNGNHRQAGTVDLVSPPQKPHFSWLKPHATFVIVLVGPEEQPFGIQKDFLCDQSGHYRQYFAERDNEKHLEYVVKLPDTSVEVFGLAQNFMYTGKIMNGKAAVPSYEGLIGLWMLGHQLEINGLCGKSLDAMIECRQTTQRIPAVPLLIQVWRDTPEGSSIRTLLLSWAAEYMRSSNARAEFAKSLPQEVLSELVVAMSAFESVSPTAPPPTDLAQPATTVVPRKIVHYLEEPSDEETMGAKKLRLLGKQQQQQQQQQQAEQGELDKGSRISLSKTQRRRSSGVHFDGRQYSPNQRLSFCADLLTRMLSGPGFWTRLVGPFKEPVEPSKDGVPDYFTKVKRPMDLGTMKAKMDGQGYKDEEEFLTDMRQIFNNCFTYWKKGDPMWTAGERLQRTFEDKYQGMNKWIAKTEGEEGE